MKKLIAVFAILAGSVLFAAPAALADGVVDTTTETPAPVETPTDTPTQETPAEETPAEETPAEETPAEPAAEQGLTKASLEKVEASAFSKKVFVCKYKNTPGPEEVLKSGKQPISVSINSIDSQFEGDPVELIGETFADAQGFSRVIAVNDGQDPPPASACLGDSSSVEATPPDAQAPTCDADGKLLLPDDTDVLTYESDPDGTGPGDYTVTVTVADGYELIGPDEFEITVEEQLSGDECAEIDDSGLLPDTGGSSPWLILGAGSMIAGGVVLLRKKQSLPVVPGYRLDI